MKGKTYRKRFLEAIESMMEEDARGERSQDKRTDFPDMPELSVVRDLLEADFSAESRVRETIRAVSEAGTDSRKPAACERGRQGNFSALPFRAGLLAAGLGFAVLALGYPALGFLLKSGNSAGASTVPVIFAPARGTAVTVKTDGDAGPSIPGDVTGLRFGLPAYLPEDTHLAGIMTPSPGTTVLLYSGDHPFVLSAVGSPGGFPVIMPVNVGNLSPDFPENLPFADKSRMKFSKVVSFDGVSYRIAASLLSVEEMEKILESIRKEER